jgi:hypothetical protein
MYERIFGYCSSDVILRLPYGLGAVLCFHESLVGKNSHKVVFWYATLSCIYWEVVFVAERFMSFRTPRNVIDGQRSLDNEGICNAGAPTISSN